MKLSKKKSTKKISVTCYSLTHTYLEYATNNSKHIVNLYKVINQTDPILKTA